MFSECSAKTGENIEYIFNKLIKKCYLLKTKGRKYLEDEENAEKNLKILNKYISF